MCGIAYLQQKNTEVVLTFSTRSHASIPVTRIESSSGGEMPALLKAMSTRPCRSTTPSKSALTCSSSLTSQATNSPPTSSAQALPASPEMSTTTTKAPSAANRRAVACPIPLPAPVITATRSCKRSTYSPVARNTFLTSVKPSNASGPSSRPRPDCFMPPNGVQYRTDEWLLTLSAPVSTARDTRSARPRSRVHSEPDRPYSVSLASRIASASSRNGSTESTGPKTSSRQCRSPVEWASNTVGGNHQPSPVGA